MGNLKRISCDRDRIVMSKRISDLFLLSACSCEGIPFKMRAPMLVTEVDMAGRKALSALSEEAFSRPT